MIITDYYRFQKLQGQKSKLRIDCVASSESYPPMEALRNKEGALFVYLGDNVYTRAGNERRADMAYLCIKMPSLLMEACKRGRL